MDSSTKDPKDQAHESQKPSPQEPKQKRLESKDLQAILTQDKDTKRPKRNIIIDEEDENFAFEINNYDIEDEEISDDEPSQETQTARLNQIESLEIFKLRKGSSESKEKDDEPNVNAVSHRILIPGIEIDTEHLPHTVKCSQLRDRNKILSIVGLSRKEDKYLQGSLLYFDENFLYVLEELNKENQSGKTVIRRLNLNKLSQIALQEYEDKIKIILVFKYYDINMEFQSDVEEESVDLFFNTDEANLFFKITNIFLKRLKIPLHIPNLAEDIKKPPCSKDQVIQSDSSDYSQKEGNQS